MLKKFLLILLILSLCSCVKHNDLERGTIEHLTLITKAMGGVNEDYQVTNDDIVNYIKYKSLEGISRRKESIVKDVVPILWQDVPCLYAVVYERGYEVISADKRSPLPLMKDEEGVFELPTEDTPIGFHLYTLAEDVWLSLYQNKSFGEPDNETIDNIESSLLFWKLISADYKTVVGQATQTKSSRDTIILDPDHGHWELIGTTTQTEVFDTSAHLTTTWWHQYYPFNEFCPYYSSIGFDRCPAGCVAIAGAQMLYYLHYKIGVPTQSPSTGYCTGFVHINLPGEQLYTQTFSNYISNTWDYMQSNWDPNLTRYAAKLIGDIGKKVNMEYSTGPEGSCASLENLRDSAFIAYGIHCSILNYYSGSFIKGNLEMGYPVLCGGFRQNTRNEGNTRGKIGHAFLIDRYIRVRNKITFLYEWIFDDPGQSPGYPIMTANVVYDSPKITMYQMNWGNGYDYNYNDVWCGMNGMWQYGDHLYTINRRLLYNCRAIEE